MIRLGTMLAGAVGFVIVIGLGLAMDRPWERALISATITALAFGLMGRWWLQMWLSSLQAAQIEQAEQQAKAMEEVAAANEEAPTTPEEEPAA
tara:strand:- start:66 stop:344 length:279 start_codon:yes stop_codon:yes gene_type:complete